MGQRIFIVFFIIMVAWQASAKNSQDSVDYQLAAWKVLESAAEMAQSINSDRGKELKIEALLQVALAESKLGNRSRSEAHFNDLMKMVEAMETPSPLAKELQEMNRRNFKDAQILQEQNIQRSLSKKIQLLTDIALAQAQGGQLQSAEQTFKCGVQFANRLPNDNSFNGKVQALIRIARMQIKAGDREGASSTYKIAYQAVDFVQGETKDDIELLRYSVASDAVWFQIQNNGDTSGASALIELGLETAKHLEDKWSQASVLRNAAIHQAALGDHEAAMAIFQKAVAARASSSRGRSAGLFYNMIDLLKIGESLTKAGKIEEARSSIRKVIEMMRTIEEQGEEAERTKSAVWQKIAIIRAQMSDIEGAIEAEAAIKDSSFKTLALAEIANAQIRSGDLKNAREIVRFLKEDPSLIRDIAVAQARSGDISGALSTSDAICCTIKIPAKAKLRGDILRIVASARIITEGHEKVLEWARSQPSPIERTYALLGIAEGLSNKMKSA